MMTRRDFMAMVIAGENNAEMVAFAQNEITKMNERNAKRSATPTKKQIANEAIVAKIAEVLTSEPITAKEIGELVGISTNQASALAKKVEGVVVTDVKIKGSGTRKGYALA